MLKLLFAAFIVGLLQGLRSWMIERLNNDRTPV